jgi:serine protease inhibitor
MNVLMIMVGHVLSRPAVPAAAVLLAALAAVPAPPAAAQQAQTAAQAQPAEPREVLAAAQAKLAFGLIDKVTNGDKQQATVSPASLASVLHLVSYGASPRMKEAIGKALGFERTEGLAALKAVRPNLTGSSDVFVFKDKLVFAPSSPPAEIALAGFKDLNVPIDIADMSNVDEAKKVDAWVKDVTKGAIPEILGGPLPKTSFAALNALHFKARWKNPFDVKQTADAPFTGIDGKSADVKMMHLSKATRIFQQEQKGERTFVAVELPFADDRFALVVVTTKEKPAAARDFAPVAAWLSGSSGSGFRLLSGDLALPRFAAAGGGDLTKALDALGLKEARRAANSLPLFGSDVALSAVLQRAMIEVDEEGAEAAAATVAIGTRTLEADDSIHMTVDKPFIYALRDKSTGLILIAGYMGTTPKAGKTA